jgi:hypothetical protein
MAYFIIEGYAKIPHPVNQRLLGCGLTPQFFKLSPLRGGKPALSGRLKIPPSSQGAWKMSPFGRHFFKKAEAMNGNHFRSEK